MRKGSRAVVASIVAFASAVAVAQTIQEYPVPKGAHPHDIAPAADGGVWYTAQHQAALGWLDPKTGKTRHIPLGQGWRQLVLKKKSTGPVVGAPSKRSLQLWFMACYDLDRFRDFVASTGFNEAYDIPRDEMQKIRSTDTELMLFAFRFLRQTMFGEESIKMKADAFEKRLARKKERDAARGDTTDE